MYDLLFDLFKRADFSLASSALLLCIVYLAWQRYQGIQEDLNTNAAQIDRLTKTFIKEGIKLYNEEED